MTGQASQHEDALIRRCQQGDAVAFDRLVELYAPRVYALAYRLVGQPDDAQDMAQEAFVRIYRALPRFKFESAFSTWMYRIVTNVCYTEISKRRNRPASLTDLESPDNDTPDRAELLAATEDVEDAWERRARQQAIQQAITELPEHFRLTLVLCDIEGHSYLEVATMLQVAEGTVKSRLNRARLLLREKLSGLRELFPMAHSHTP